MSTVIKLINTAHWSQDHNVKEVFANLPAFYPSKELKTQIEEISIRYRAEYYRGKFGSVGFADFLKTYGDAIRSIIIFENPDGLGCYRLDENWDKKKDDYHRLSDAKWLMIVGLAWLKIAFQELEKKRHMAAACFLKEVRHGFDELRCHFEKNRKDSSGLKGDHEVALYLKAIELGAKIPSHISYADQAKKISKEVREYGGTLGRCAITEAKLTKWLRQEADGRFFFSKA